MKAIILSLPQYSQTNIFMGTKKHVDFLVKVKKVVRAIDPRIQFKSK